MAIFPKAASNWFYIWMKSAELAKIAFHQLIYTSASLLIANGIDIASVSRRLGHSNLTTTLNTYTHALEKIDRSASEAFDTIFIQAPDTLGL